MDRNIPQKYWAENKLKIKLAIVAIFVALIVFLIWTGNISLDIGSVIVAGLIFIVIVIENIRSQNSIHEGSAYDNAVEIQFSMNIKDLNDEQAFVYIKKNEGLSLKEIAKEKGWSEKRIYHIWTEVRRILHGISNRSLNH